MTRVRVQIQTPLDFLVVTDHSEFMGVLPELAEGNHEMEAVIDEVMAMEEHSWKKGLSPEDAQRVREFYEKRYGEGAEQGDDDE